MILMEESFRLFGGNSAIVEPFMAALEMIHNYSLVHDDLPAMSAASPIMENASAAVSNALFNSASPASTAMPSPYTFQVVLRPRRYSSLSIAGRSSDEAVKKLEQAAENIGIAFQIQDDILDVTSSLEVLGKPVGSDEKNHKVTYVRLNGLEQSKKDVEALSEEALKILSSFDRRNEFLEDLVRALITREK